LVYGLIDGGAAEQSLGVDVQFTDGFTGTGTGDRLGLGRRVVRAEGMRVEPARAQGSRKLGNGRRPDRLARAHGSLQRGEVEIGGLVGNAACGKFERKVRSTCVRGLFGLQRPQPLDRVVEEEVASKLDTATASGQRNEQVEMESEDVGVGEPGRHRVRRLHAPPVGMHAGAVPQRLLSQAHTFGIGCGT